MPSSDRLLDFLARGCSSTLSKTLNETFCGQGKVDIVGVLTKVTFLKRCENEKLDVIVTNGYVPLSGGNEEFGL